MSAHRPLKPLASLATRPSLLLVALLAAFAAPAAFADGLFFVPGDLVVSVEGNGVAGATSGMYTDNQAAPLSLFQYSVNGTSSASYVNSLVLPQTASGSNFAVSGEYGSSSEGTLQLSGNGQYLTIMGYGVNAAAFNANPTAYGTLTTDPTKSTALGQSGSLQGQGYIAVPRVVALIGADGSVDSSTAVYGVFNGNNPRSAYTANGSSIYISGQGLGGGVDATGGVFLTQRGSHSATSITGADAGNSPTGTPTSQDTRDVQIHNGTLVTSVDSKSGATNRDTIGTLGTAGTPPTSVANGGNGPTMLNGIGNSGGTGKITITAATGNGLNNGLPVNLSPENFFYANAATLYIADSGIPKNDSNAPKGASTSLGDGGLQKWVNSKPDGSGTWSLAYTLSAGLNLVPNTQADNPTGDDTTGLLGLAGEVIGNEVELFATNFTIGDVDPTFLYGITDNLSATALPGSEVFTQLAAAPADSTFKGVSFAPTAVPEPASLALVGFGLFALGAVRKSKKRQA